MSNRQYNPERRTWRGKSYRATGRNIREMRELDRWTNEPIDSTDDWGDSGELDESAESSM
jgi:hypothetical protein